MAGRTAGKKSTGGFSTGGLRSEQQLAKNGPPGTAPLRDSL